MQQLVEQKKNVKTFSTDAQKILVKSSDLRYTRLQVVAMYVLHNSLRTTLHSFSLSHWRKRK